MFSKGDEISAEIKVCDSQSAGYAKVFLEVFYLFKKNDFFINK